MPRRALSPQPRASRCARIHPPLARPLLASFPRSHVMYRSILSAELRFGPHIGRAARVLLKGLLTRDPLRRLGAKGSSQVRRAAFFRSLDFKKVYQRAYTPAFRPTLVGSSPSLQAYRRKDPNPRLGCASERRAFVPLWCHSLTHPMMTWQSGCQ